LVPGSDACSVVVDHDGIVDKFVGDEVIGLYIPALTDGSPARQAVDSGLELLKVIAQGCDAAEVQVGVGVNTGVAYVGAVALHSTWSSPCLPTPSM
jgi:adenylate cyclase